jgi:hypothetical protein
MRIRGYVYNVELIKVIASGAGPKDESPQEPKPGGSKDK